MESCIFAVSNGARRIELGHYQLSVDLTVLDHAQIRTVAREHGISVADLSTYVSFHEDCHRRQGRSSTLLTILELNSANCAELLNWTQDSDAERTKRQLLGNAIAKRRIFLDSHPVLEALAVFLSTHGPVPPKVVAVFGRDVEAPDQRAILSGLARLREWSGGTFVPELAGAIALTGGDPIAPEACSQRLPLEFSAYERFWKIFQGLEELHNAKDLATFPEVAKANRNQSTLSWSTRLQVFKAFLNRVSDSTGLTIFDVAPSQPWSTALEFVMGPRGRGPGPATRKPPSSSPASVSCYTALLNYPRPGLIKLVVRAGLSKHEQFLYELNLVASHLVDQILTGKDPICYMGARRICSPTCSRPCAQILSTAQGLKDKFDGADGGGYDEIWQELRSQKS